MLDRLDLARRDNDHPYRPPRTCLFLFEIQNTKPSDLGLDAARLVVPTRYLTEYRRSSSSSPPPVANESVCNEEPTVKVCYHSTRKFDSAAYCGFSCVYSLCLVDIRVMFSLKKEEASIVGVIICIIAYLILGWVFVV